MNKLQRLNKDCDMPCCSARWLYGATDHVRWLYGVTDHARWLYGATDHTRWLFGATDHAPLSCPVGQEFGP
jgi:hypothetical protein